MRTASDCTRAAGGSLEGVLAVSTICYRQPGGHPCRSLRPQRKRPEPESAPVGPDGPFTRARLSFRVNARIRPGQPVLSCGQPRRYRPPAGLLNSGPPATVSGSVRAGLVCRRTVSDVVASMLGTSCGSGRCPKQSCGAALIESNPLKGSPVSSDFFRTSVVESAAPCEPSGLGHESRLHRATFGSFTLGESPNPLECSGLLLLPEAPQWQPCASAQRMSRSLWSLHLLWRLRDLHLLPDAPAARGGLPHDVEDGSGEGAKQKQAGALAPAWPVCSSVSWPERGDRPFSSDSGGLHHRATDAAGPCSKSATRA
jgi:hypothetical protein